jgi:hypothetical protein
MIKNQLIEFHDLQLKKLPLLLKVLEERKYLCAGALRLNHWRNAIHRLYPAESSTGLNVQRTGSTYSDLLWINEIFHSAHLLSSKILFPFKVSP